MIAGGGGGGGGLGMQNLHLRHLHFGQWKRLKLRSHQGSQDGASHLYDLQKSQPLHLQS